MAENWSCQWTAHVKLCICCILVNVDTLYITYQKVTVKFHETEAHFCEMLIRGETNGSWHILTDITGRTALAVRPDVVNAKYHVITNATYNRDPVPAKFKHVMNIDTCTLLCCDYSTLWEALHVNMVEIGARCSDKNVKILGRYQWIGW